LLGAMAGSVVTLLAAVAVNVALPSGVTRSEIQPYRWLPEPVPLMSRLDRRILPPAGFERAPQPDGSFGEWLRGLPLKPGIPPVLLYDGRPKLNQAAHAAVLDVDVGARDLQQCADAVIRLRAEYLFGVGDMDRISFRFTSGDRADFRFWRLGQRPVVDGSHVRWRRTAAPDASYRSLRRYLDVVFTYAGTASLAGELSPLADPAAVRPGDVLVQGGFPGHAAIILDVAEHERTGQKVFLLAQSYMPAQEVQILRNPTDPVLSPWYSVAAVQDRLVTPEWVFRRDHLRTWPP